MCALTYICRQCARTTAGLRHQKLREVVHTFSKPMRIHSSRRPRKYTLDIFSTLASSSLRHPTRRLHTQIDNESTYTHITKKKKDNIIT